MSMRFHRALLRAASPFVLLGAVAAAAQAQQVVLPEIVVEAQRSTPPRPNATSNPKDPNSDLAATNTRFDEARDNLSPRFGASCRDSNRGRLAASGAASRAGQQRALP